jgi:hypothetical protein
MPRKAGVDSDENGGLRGPTALVLALAWGAMCIPSFWVLPALDDWATSTPLPFSWDALKLNGALWRPLHNLERMFAAPLAYPFVAHLENALLQAASAAILFAILIRLQARRSAATVATLVLLISPAVGASVWSIDGVHHMWSRTLGLAALLAFLSARQGLLLWSSLALLSAGWSEGGIAWFVVPIVVREALDKRRPLEPSWRAALPVCVTGVVAYFALRFGLSGGGLSLGGAGGRYTLTFRPHHWFRNAAVLIGVAMSTVDTVALLDVSPHRLIAAATALAGLPLLVMAVLRVRRSLLGRRAALSMLALGVLLGPFVLLGHVSEMYCHAVLALLLVLLAPVEGDERQFQRTAWLCAIALYCAAALTVDFHKLANMIETGRGSAQVGREVARLIPAHTPSPLCVVIEKSPSRVGYSVFTSPAGPASAWGEAARMEWGWNQGPHIIQKQRPEDCSGPGQSILVSLAGQVRSLR